MKKRCKFLVLALTLAAAVGFMAETSASAKTQDLNTSKKIVRMMSSDPGDLPPVH